MKKVISGYTKKALRGLAALMLVFTMAVMSFAMTASAVKKQQFKLDSAQDIEVILLYEGDAPTFTVKAPGKTYSKDQDYTKVEKKPGVTYLYIKDAPAGSWTIEANKDIDFNVLKWYGSVRVTSFTNEAPKNDKVKFKATVKAEENVYINWYLYAVNDGSITGSPQKVLLADGSAEPGKEFSRDADIDRLPDGEWKLVLDVTADYGSDLEADANAEAAQPFTVTGHTAQGDISKIVADVDITGQEISVDWSKVEDDYDYMLVSAVNKDGELLIYDKIERGITSTSFLANSDVTLRLMPVDNEYFKEMYTLKLAFAPAVKVSIDTPELTGDLMVQISYEAGSSTVPAEIVLNGKKNIYNLTGSGTMSLPLDQMSANQVSVTYTLPDGEKYTVSKTINVQSAPSSIEFFGVKDRLVTDQDKITISGRTDPDAKLTLGDAEVKVEENGDFTASAELEKGENILTFNIESPMGIRTTRTVTVVRTISGGSASAAMSNSEIPLWVQLVFGAAVVVLCAAGIFIAIRIAKKKKLDMQGKILLVFRIFLIISFVILIAAGVFCLYEMLRVSSSVSGDRLIERLEGGDYDGLDNVLSIRDTWLSRMILLFVMAGICAVVFVITIFIGKWLKKLKVKPKKPKLPKAPKPPKQPREPRAPRFAYVPEQSVPEQSVTGQSMPAQPASQQPVSLDKATQDAQPVQQPQQYTQGQQYPQQYTQGQQYPQQYTQGQQYPQQYTQGQQYPQQYTQGQQYPQQYTQGQQYPQQYTQGQQYPPQNGQNGSGQ